MELQELTYKIRGAIFTVHKELGPGLFENVYEIALIHELEMLGLKAESQVKIPIIYKDISIPNAFVIDVLVEDSVVIEIKSVTELSSIHKKQLLTYLKLSNKKVGFLVNFNDLIISDKESLVRIVN